MTEEIKIKRKSIRNFFIGVIVLMFVVLTYYFLFYSPSFSVNFTNIPAQTETLQAKFVRLNSANSNYCAGPQILDNSDADRLQGACCGAMDFHRYEEQIEGLKKYKKIKQIPDDPYDIPRELADELLDYQKNIKLNSEEEKIYDDAVAMSMEGGPCCCKCWRWYAFEGLSKYLITEKNFEAEEIAGVWELIDGCGGPGHVEGVSEH